MADAEELAVMPATVAIDGKVKNKYPKILGFIGTGFFKEDNIIENQNKFVEEFDIIKRVHLFPYSESIRKNLFEAYEPFKGRIQGVIDHPEMFKTRKLKLILICSNYSELPPSELGMRRYTDLYTKNCPTYIRIFEPGEWKNMIFWLEQHKKARLKFKYYQNRARNIENIINKADFRPKLFLPSKSLGMRR